MHDYYQRQEKQDPGRAKGDHSLLHQISWSLAARDKEKGV